MSVTAPTAYRVPFRLDRSRGPRVLRLVNDGPETVSGLRVTLLGSGLLVPVSTAALQPGESMSVSVIGPELVTSSIAVVRWFRPTREEYLWRFSF
ncbi:hypothetical protein [Frigoribacterium faeni]|jgi:hypothetical protein|uniref:hypothetical protein n=1 Tax=Frigoribacterium faeni TaxID=145483 RepID=UPI00141B2B5C|nr:hypothetical protein [Frigoribacterium faeni]NIJ06041.1 archaellum component FlaF (FlaF/FlaG flagellin family) [Frigoribacterium faeni]